MSGINEGEVEGKDAEGPGSPSKLPKTPRQKGKIQSFEYKDIRAQKSIIKRYAALIVSLAGFEVEEMKKLGFDHMLGLYDRMHEKVTTQAKLYKQYGSGVTSDDILNALKTRKGSKEQEGKLWWRRFRDIKQIVINKLTPTFISTLTPDRRIASGCNLASCLLKTRKLLYLTKKKTLVTKSKQGESSDSDGTSENDQTMDVSEENDAEVGVKNQERPVDVDTQDQKCANATDTSISDELLKKKVDLDAVKMPPSFYPNEWLVFINLGLPAGFTKDSNGNYKTVASEFMLVRSEGNENLPADEEEEVKREHTPQNMLSRKHQREKEKLNYKWGGSSKLVKRNASILSETESLAIFPEPLMTKKMQLKEIELKLEAAKAAFAAAKDMGDSEGQNEAYATLKEVNRQMKERTEGAVHTQTMAQSSSELGVEVSTVVKDSNGNSHPSAQI